MRNTALDRKWSPPISGASNASAMRTSVLLTMVRYFRHGSSEGSAPSAMSSNSRPTSAGAHRFLVAPHALEPAAPCTDSMQTSRVLFVAAAAAPAFPNALNAGVHRVEIWKRNRRAHSAKEGAPRNALSSEDLHVSRSPSGLALRVYLSCVDRLTGSARLLRNALLFTTPNDERRHR